MGVFNFAFLSGYKTYIVAFAMGAVAIAEGMLGWDVPNVDLTGDWFETLMLALGLGFLRNGVATDTAA